MEEGSTTPRDSSPMVLRLELSLSVKRKLEGRGQVTVFERITSLRTQHKLIRIKWAQDKPTPTRT